MQENIFQNSHSIFIYLFASFFESFIGIRLARHVVRTEDISLSEQLSYGQLKIGKFPNTSLEKA